MRRLVPVAAVLLAVACGPHARDVRVPVPLPQANTYDVVTPEQIIEAGSEKMFCTDIIYRGEDTAMVSVDSRQGKFGHHVILLATKKPKPEGTTYDCTDAASMKDFEPFAIMDLPEGSGTPLPTGKAMVVQLHYVNTSREAILVRDVVRVGIRPQSEVRTWVAPFGINTAQFKVPPNAVDSKVTFDCPVKQEADLILLGGHMHERGTAIKAELGPDANSLTTRYQVDQWKAEYRDAPPVELFMSSPLHVTPGMVLRTSCAWNNDSNHEISFPEEMCAAFGLLSGTKDPWVCNLGVE